MLGAAAPRELFGERCFIGFGAFVFFKPKRDRAQNPALLGRQRGNRSRVESGRQKNADRYIGHKVITNAFAQCGTQAFAVSDFSFRISDFGFFAVAKKRSDGAECFWEPRPVLVDPHACPGGETGEAAIKRVWIGHVTPEKKADKPP